MSTSKKLGLSAVLALFVTLPVFAGAISTAQWYTFGFEGTGWAIAGSSGFVLGQNSVYADAPPWTLTVGAGGAMFKLTDGFLSGDSFSLYDGATLIGSTPAVSTGANCSNDEPACLANPAMSHALFALAPGSYSFQIQVDNAPYGSGAGFFRVDDGVPEPGSWLLAFAGLAGVAVLRRRIRA